MSRIKLAALPRRPARRRGIHTKGANIMWYFSWVLGVAFACSFAILNALWFELDNDGSEDGF